MNTNPKKKMKSSSVCTASKATSSAATPPTHTVPCTPLRGNFAAVTTEDKVAYGKTFLEKVQKTNKKASVGAATHKDLLDVLVKNGMSRALLEGKNGKFTGSPKLYSY